MIAAGFEYVVVVQAMKQTGQDRAAVFERGRGIVIVLADGAGGTSHGEVAAQTVVDTVELAAPDADWGGVLDALDTDRRLDGGQTTAIVLAVDGAGIRGSSIGDSEAWLVHPDHVDALTSDQQRKPLLGGGGSPASIAAGPVANATLVVASDGLVRYAKATDIARIALQPELAIAATQLIDLVRLPNGKLPDDVSIVLCRARS